MKVLSIFYIIAFLVYLSFGIYMLFLYLSEKRKNFTFIIFFFLCIFFAVSSLNYAFLVSCKDENGCWFWYKMTVPAITLFPSILLHFFFDITKFYKSRFKWLIFLNYFVSVIFLIKGLTGVFTIDHFVQKKYGWEGIHTVGSFWYSAYTIYYIVNLTICLILILKWYFKTKSLREKKQAQIMFFASIITTFINILLQTILPILNIYVIPKAPLVIMLIWIFGIWYAMVKYRFMIPSIQISSQEIISNIDEMILILDVKLNIIEVNNKFIELMSLTEKDVKNRNIFDFIVVDDIVKSYFYSLVDGYEEKFLCRIDYISMSKESIITDSYVSKIRDRFSDFIGILLISSENKDIKQFQRVYKITKREFEIIELTISGFSNIEISKKLSISERTVETHLNNIYNKLAISNRMELINVAYDFNLIKKKLI
ncbi:MAG: LuxR C-terminal-related transcriptional regulator [Brevinematales bacterium]|nr:LuxR C-terminal-related transcriptional regulator [Brevinematales bacterium]